MLIIKSTSGDPPSGFIINNYDQQSEPLLSSRRLEELLQKSNRKKLVLYFCIGVVMTAFLAVATYGKSPGVFNQVGSPGSKEQCSKRVIGYHRLWLPYSLTDSQLSKLTHLVFMEVEVDKNGTIYFSDSTEQKRFEETNERARKFQVKTLITFSVPGELLGAKRVMIDSILNFTHDNHLDGIEISSLRIFSQEGIQNAFDVCKELRQKLRTLNKTEFTISLSVFPTKMNTESKDFLEYVDFVNIRTGSYYAPYFAFDSGLIGPPSPLYGNSSTRGDLGQHMKLYSCYGKTSNRLNMMVKFSGCYWNNVIPPENPSDTLRMRAEIKNETAEGGDISWKELKNSEVWNISNASWNDEWKTPYIWNPENRTYLAFENERSITEKMKYAMSKNFGGVAIDSLPEDDDENSLLNIVSSEQWCSSENSDEVNYDCD